MRHRVFVKQAHLGVTGDKRHDSYSMRFFVKAAMGHLSKQTVGGEPLLEHEMITLLTVHSDNAAQVDMYVFVPPGLLRPFSCLPFYY